MADNSNKGFASMSHDKVEEIASKGGKAAQQSGHAHELTDEEQSEGGHDSPTQFQSGDERTEEAAQKGGES